MYQLAASFCKMRGRYILRSKDLVLLYRFNMNHLALFALWFRIGATVVIFGMCY